MSYVISYILPVISVFVSVASIILSIKVYRRDTPKLQVDIENPKYDCFFGNVAVEDHSEQFHKNRICGVYFTLRNNSGVDIEVSGMALKIKSDTFRLIPNDISYWDNVYFFAYDADAKKMIIDLNSSISYTEMGVHLPLIVQSYRSFSGYALFYNFPVNIAGSVNATLYIKTAIGIYKKKVTLLEYNDTFQRQELEDIKQYQTSIGDRK